MKKQITLAVAFVWAAIGAHGAEEGYAGGPSHHKEHVENELNHHAEHTAEANNLATSLSQFVEDAIKVTEALQEENKEILAGGEHPSKLGFKDTYDSREVHEELEKLVKVLKRLEEISKNHSL